MSGFIPTVEGWEAELEGRPGLPGFVTHGARDPVISVDFARDARAAAGGGGADRSSTTSTAAAHHLDPRTLPRMTAVGRRARRAVRAMTPRRAVRRAARAERQRVMDIARNLVDAARNLTTSRATTPDRAYRLRTDEHVPDGIRRIARGQLHDARDELDGTPSRHARRGRARDAQAPQAPAGLRAPGARRDRRADLPAREHRAAHGRPADLRRRATRTSCSRRSTG